MSTMEVCAPHDVSALRFYWEDMTPGLQFETSSRTVTEADVVSFAALSADYNRVHVDAEYAAGTAWGTRIAHGMLVASIMSGLNTRTVVNQLLEPSLVGMLETSFRFPRPTLIGDTIKVSIEVTGRRETSNAARGIVEFRRVALNQHGDVVCECLVKMMVSRRPGATPAAQ
ncbi:acyl dehydratase (plasmid) [Burkholderia sp. KK1]|nr:acyl dehydratase [Burkholderia sp. KK1]